MSQANLIYGLVDPRTLLVRYVGLSSSGLYRPRQHGTPDRLREGNYKTRWIRQLLAAGLDYTIVVLEEVASKDALSEAERFWIAYGRACGWPLTNANTGGSGMVGGHHTAETRAKMSAWQVGKKLSPETRAKISAARIGQKPNAATRAKLSAASRGKKKSPQHAARIAAALRGKKKSAQHVARMSAYMKQRSAARRG